MHDFTHWQSSYSVGNWVLDNQHKVILSLFKQAIECIPDGSQDAALQFRMIRNDLLDCVHEHFGTEEAVLSHCRYPLLENHREEHADFHLQLASLLMSTARGEIDKVDFHHHLSDWWLSHVVGADKQFAGAIQRVR